MTTLAALLERATLISGILRDLVRLQGCGLTAPPAVTGWLVTRLHVDLAALGRGADMVGKGVPPG